MALTFSQGNTGQTAGATNTQAVSYTGAQTAGDLNIVAVNYDNSGAATAVQSVTDSQGNTYKPCPVTNVDSAGQCNQEIWYCERIAAHAAGNSVTVTLNGNCGTGTFGGIEVFIEEYTGSTVWSLDQMAKGSGSTGGNTANGIATNAVTLSHANEVCFAFTTVNSSATAGTGFTQRQLNGTFSDVAEDKIVTAGGSVTGQAQQSSSGSWGILMATFATISTLPDDDSGRRRGGPSPMSRTVSDVGVEVLARLVASASATSIAAYDDGAPVPLPRTARWKPDLSGGGGGVPLAVGAGPWMADDSLPPVASRRARQPEDLLPLGAPMKLSALLVDEMPRPWRRPAQRIDDAAVFDATKPLPKLFAEEPPVARGKVWQAAAAAAADQASAFSPTKPLSTLFAEEPVVRGTGSKAAQIAAFDQAAAFSPTKPNLGTSVGPFGDDPPRAWARPKPTDDAFVPKTLATVVLPSIGWAEEPARVGASTPRQRLFAYTIPEQVLDDVSLAALSKFGYAFDEARGRWKRPAVFDEAVPLGDTKPLLSVGAMQDDARARVVARPPTDDALVPSTGRLAIPWGDEPKPPTLPRARPSDELVLSGHPTTSLPFADDVPRRPVSRQAPDDALPFRPVASVVLPSIGWNEEPPRVGARTPPSRAILAQESAQIFESVHVVVLPSIGWLEERIPIRPIRPMVFDDSEISGLASSPPPISVVLSFPIVSRPPSGRPQNRYRIARGSTLALPRVFEQLTGAAVDLTGGRVLFVLKHFATDPDASAVAILDNEGLGGVTITHPILGRAQITVPASATLGFFNIVTRLVYEIWLHDALGNEWRTELGEVFVHPRLPASQP